MWRRLLTVELIPAGIIVSYCLTTELGDSLVHVLERAMRGGRPRGRRVEASELFSLGDLPPSQSSRFESAKEHTKKRNDSACG